MLVGQRLHFPVGVYSDFQSFPSTTNDLLHFHFKICCMAIEPTAQASADKGCPPR